MAGARRLESEHTDTSQRRYAYDFDYRMHDFMLRTFEPLPVGRALELGCYHGEFTKKLVARFPSVTVVEGASDLIAIAAENVGSAATFVHDRFESFAPAKRFDAVFLIHTLEHLDDPQSILRRIPGWLNPGGRFYAAVPNAFAASRQIAVEMGLIAAPTAVTPGEWEHGHRRTYDLAALVTEMSEAGFTVRESGGIVFKAFANFQFDKALESGIVGDEYLEGCYRLGKRYPNLCSSIYTVSEVE
jgi:2-polyprenyl-3-methyl-5-hydroxy-6-metoxy-1,4-benzoquinol methylase